MTYSNYLRTDIPEERLEEMYSGEDYYWYLKSPEFKETFLEPLADIINSIGEPVLDVGCGEGWLAELITVPYVGIDGSGAAIDTATLSFPQKTFAVGRIEYPVPLWGNANTLLLGNILYLLIKRNHFIDFIDLYRECFDLEWVIVYDLQNLDTSSLEAEYKRVSKVEASAPLKLKPDIKRHRKIEVYKI